MCETVSPFSRGVQPVFPVREEVPREDRILELFTRRVSSDHQVLTIADTHLMPYERRKPSSSGKALGIGYGRFVRLHQIARRMTRKIFASLLPFEKSGTLVHLGDIFDTFEINAFLRIATQLQSWIPSGDQPTQIIVVPGNHDQGFRGPDVFIGYRPVSKRFPPLPYKKFEEIVNRIKRGGDLEG